MADFYNLWANKNKVMDKLHALQKDAEDNAELESQSANKIQQCFRGQSIRGMITAQRLAAQAIGRIFRGHMGRKRSNGEKQTKIRHERMAVFHYHSLLVQKRFRGFYSRRYYHDFFARKAYIQSVVVKSDALRVQLEKQLEEQQRKERETQIEKARSEFTEVTQNLHHLVSTKVTPGIYNSPYLQEALPTAFNQPIEEHLRTGVKDLLRSRSRKQGDVLSALQPQPVDRRSVQATSNYSVVQNSTRMDEKYSKMQRLDKKSFLSGGTARDLATYTVSVQQGNAFMDKWRNPYTQRGIPQGEADLDPRTTTLGKFPKKPFFTAVGGNKSTVLNNDRFDVVHEHSFAMKHTQGS